MKKINYTGQSKVIRRLCEQVNALIDQGSGGGGDPSPLYYGDDGGLHIDYDKVRTEEAESDGG